MRYVENVNVIKNGDNIEVRDGDIVIFSCPRENYYKRKVKKKEEYKEYITKEEAIKENPELSKIKVINRNEPFDIMDLVDELDGLTHCWHHWTDYYDYGVIRKSFGYNDNGRVVETRTDIYIKFVPPSEIVNTDFHSNGKVAKKKKVPKRKNKKKHKKY